MINSDLNIIPLYHSNKEHGLSKQIMNELKSVEPTLLIILDASTNDTKECKKLKELGWRVVS